ncbi:MAG: lipocalin-like domain-containing protein [Verrucomicrobia bacterium]|nr:lipocalin-like domain-containing protein [Verrucomicrobiota bacterium]
MTTLALFGSEERGVSDGVRDRFIGAWRLAWLEEEGADGNVHRADCTGLLVYTRDGHMSVQVMTAKGRQEIPLCQSNMRKAATKLPMAPMRSTNALTPSSITWTADWCAP